MENFIKHLFINDTQSHQYLVEIFILSCFDVDTRSLKTNFLSFHIVQLKKYKNFRILIKGLD